MKYKIYRRYTTNNKLDTWIQRHCIICQRFLSKQDKKYCAKCRSIIHKTGNLAYYYRTREERQEKHSAFARNYYAKHREHVLERMKEFYQKRKVIE